MDSYEVIRIAMSVIDRILNSDDITLKHQHLVDFEKEYPDEYVNLWAAEALLQDLCKGGQETIGFKKYIEPCLIMNSMGTIMQSGSDFDEIDLALHPLPLVPLWTLVAVIADIATVNYSKHKLSGIRALSVIMSSDKNQLDDFSYDECVLVRFAVAKNRNTEKQTLERLSSDRFWHVYRETYESYESEDLKVGIWPIDCGC